MDEDSKAVPRDTCFDVFLQQLPWDTLVAQLQRDPQGSCSALKRLIDAATQPNTLALHDKTKSPLTPRELQESYLPSLFRSRLPSVEILVESDEICFYGTQIGVVFLISGAVRLELPGVASSLGALEAFSAAFEKTYTECQQCPEEPQLVALSTAVSLLCELDGPNAAHAIEQYFSFCQQMSDAVVTGNMSRIGCRITVNGKIPGVLITYFTSAFIAAAQRAEQVKIYTDNQNDVHDFDDDEIDYTSCFSLRFRITLAHWESSDLAMPFAYCCVLQPPRQVESETLRQIANTNGVLECKCNSQKQLEQILFAGGEAAVCSIATLLKIDAIHHELLKSCPSQALVAVNFPAVTIQTSQELQIRLLVQDIGDAEGVKIAIDHIEGSTGIAAQQLPQLSALVNRTRMISPLLDQIACLGGASASSSSSSTHSAEQE